MACGLKGAQGPNIDQLVAQAREKGIKANRNWKRETILAKLKEHDDGKTQKKAATAKKEKRPVPKKKGK